MFMWLLEIGYFNVHAVMLWIAQVKYEKLFLQFVFHITQTMKEAENKLVWECEGELNWAIQNAHAQQSGHLVFI